MVSPELMEAQQKQFDDLFTANLDELRKQKLAQIEEVPEYRAPQLHRATLSLDDPRLIQGGAPVNNPISLKQQIQIRLLRSR